MNRLEIIHLRLTGDVPAALDDLICEFPAAAAGDQVEVTAYRREGLSFDVAVHIRYLAESPPAGPCPLALRLAAALREFGLVEHTAWEELE